MMWKTSRGSHRRAVHFRRSAWRVAIAGASWLTFLVSAVAEWGLNIDLPLTPTAWLVFAVGAIALLVAPRASSSIFQGLRATGPVAIHASPPTGNCSRSVSCGGSFARNDKPVPKLTLRPQVLLDTPSHAPVSPPRPIVSEVRDSRRTLITIFMKTASSRGPPGTTDNHAFVPALQLCAARRASTFAVPSTVKENHT